MHLKDSQPVVIDGQKLQSCLNPGDELPRLAAPVASDDHCLSSVTCFYRATPQALPVGVCEVGSVNVCCHMCRKCSKKVLQIAKNLIS